MMARWNTEGKRRASATCPATHLVGRQSRCFRAGQSASTASVCSLAVLQPTPLQPGKYCTILPCHDKIQVTVFDSDLYSAVSKPKLSDHASYASVSCVSCAMYCRTNLLMSFPSNRRSGGFDSSLSS